jgi:hypothetical protein
MIQTLKFDRLDALLVLFARNGEFLGLEFLLDKRTLCMDDPLMMQRIQIVEFALAVLLQGDEVLARIISLLEGLPLERHLEALDLRDVQAEVLQLNEFLLLLVALAHDLLQFLYDELVYLGGLLGCRALGGHHVVLPFRQNGIRRVGLQFGLAPLSLAVGRAVDSLVPSAMFRMMGRLLFDK